MSLERSSAYIEGYLSGYAREIRLNKTLLMLQAFVDESLSVEDQKDYVLAGYIQKTSVWMQFSDEWEKILNDSPPLKAFHMHEAQSGLTGGNRRPNNPFFGWTDEQIRQKILCLSSVINKHAPWSIEVRLSTSQFEKVCLPIVPYDLKNPYIFCYFGLIRKLLEFHDRLGIDGKIQLFFDKKDDVSREASHLYSFFKSVQPPAFQNLLNGTPIFENDEKVLPLQAADMLVWSLRRKAEQRNKDEINYAWNNLFPDKHLVLNMTDDALLTIANNMSKVEGIEDTRTRKGSIVLPEIKKKKSKIDPAPVDGNEFTRIIRNLLKMPPKTRADSKLGTKKKQGKIIPPAPKTKDRNPK
jgi:hypothetical protein